MASERQRERKRAQRVQHGLAAQEARQEALASAPAVVSPLALAEHMGDQGYEQDERGKWRRRFSRPRDGRFSQKRGPVLKRKGKK